MHSTYYHFQYWIFAWLMGWKTFNPRQAIILSISLLEYLVSVLVCSGCCKKIHRLDGLKTIHIYFSQLCRLGSPRFNTQADSVSDESLITGSYLAILSLCLHKVGGVRELSGISFIRVLLWFVHSLSSLKLTLDFNLNCEVLRG
jgi:hypothetical protein